MILTYITGSLTLGLLFILWSLVTIGFWFTFAIIFVGLASLLSGIIALTTWATGRRAT